MTASGLNPSTLETWTPSVQLTSQYTRLSVSETWLQRLFYAVAYGSTSEERWAKRLVALLNNSFAGVLNQDSSSPHVLTQSDKLHIARRIFCESYGERNPLLYRLPEVDAFGRVLFAELTAWLSAPEQGPLLVHATAKTWSLRASARDNSSSAWTIAAVKGELVANSHPA